MKSQRNDRLIVSGSESDYKSFANRHDDSTSHYNENKSSSANFLAIMKIPHLGDHVISFLPSAADRLEGYNAGRKGYGALKVVSKDFQSDRCYTKDYARKAFNAVIMMDSSCEPKGCGVILDKKMSYFFERPVDYYICLVPPVGCIFLGLLITGCVSNVVLSGFAGCGGGTVGACKDLFFNSRYELAKKPPQAVRAPVRQTMS